MKKLTDKSTRIDMNPSRTFAGLYKLENNDTLYRRTKCPTTIYGSGTFDKGEKTFREQPIRVVVQSFRSAGSMMERFADGSILETDFFGECFLYTPVKRPKLPKKIRRRWKHRLVLRMVDVHECYLAGRKFRDYREALEWGKLIVGDRKIPWEYKGSNAKVRRHKWMIKHCHLVPRPYSEWSERDRLFYGKQIQGKERHMK
jgi:hypothetical protein